MRKFLLLLAPLLLTACVDGTGSYLVDGTNQHALSLRVRQDYFWNDGVNLTLMITRLPECQRQIPLHLSAATGLTVDVYAAGERNWIVKDGESAWQVQSESCGLISDKPAAPTGAKLGSFKIVDGKVVFEAAPQAAAPAAPAPTPAAEAQPAAEAAPAEAAPAASQ